MSERVELLDFARGVALIAMCIFHFAFDLELFGVVGAGFIEQTHWIVFARSIAISFLFLAGFSLYLGHGATINWPSWWRRFLKIVAASALVTIATFWATPSQYIFFGILHQIAFASLVGLLFLNVPAWLTIACACLVFIIGQTYSTPLLDHSIWLWTGLSQLVPVSSDYVPVFPWTSPVLFGIGFAQLCKTHNLMQWLSKPKLKGRFQTLLKFFGKHSLVFYLVHQPILISLLVAGLWITGSN